ncbi:MAG: hypothetical protein WC761_00830 [Candidatus Paceibacterota bacterium]|jgi:hypothetical protein
MNQDNKFVHAVVLFFTAIPAALYKAWVFQCLWAWFVVGVIAPFFGLVLAPLPLGVAVAMGFLLGVVYNFHTTLALTKVFVHLKIDEGSLLLRVVEQNVFSTALLIAGGFWHFVLWPIFGF